MRYLLLALLFGSIAVAGQAQEPSTAVGDAEAAKLAQQLSNPVAALISVPLQGNWNSGGGPDGKGSQYILNVQPVIPFSISENYSVISRTIVPFITQTDVTPGPDTGQTGLGDTTQSLFISPKAPIGGWLILGFGPVLQLPTGTDASLSSGKWSAGPTVVALTQSKGWTVGVLANQLWSFAGNSERNNVSAMYLQPFVSYTTKQQTTFGLNTETTCNWELEGNQCAVPINLTVGQLVRFGKQPVQFTGGGRYYVSRPAGTPEWGLRFVVTLLFPTGKK